jgi:hypothetical protein
MPSPVRPHRRLQHNDIERSRGRQSRGRLQTTTLLGCLRFLFCSFLLSACSAASWDRAYGEGSDGTAWICIGIIVAVVLGVIGGGVLAIWGKKAAAVMGIIILGGGYWLFSDTPSPGPQETASTKVTDNRLAELTRANIDTAPFTACIDTFEQKAQRAANQSGEVLRFLCSTFVFEVVSHTVIRTKTKCQNDRPVDFIAMRECLKKSFGQAAKNKARSFQSGAKFRIPFWRSYAPNGANPAGSANTSAPNGSEPAGAANNGATEQNTNAPRARRNTSNNSDTTDAQRGDTRTRGAPTRWSQPAPSLRASVRLQGTPTILGSLAPGAVNSTLSSRFSVLTACFQPSVDAGDASGGTMRLKLQVKKTGKVKRVTVESNSLSSDAVSKCVKRGLKSTQFPSSSSGRPTDISATFRFEAE